MLIRGDEPTTPFFHYIVTENQKSARGTIDPGASGENVSEPQRFLAKESKVYPEGLITGFYGELTQTAVARYQCKKAIVCSGNLEIKVPHAQGLAEAPRIRFLTSLAEINGFGRAGPKTIASINVDIRQSIGRGVDVYAPMQSSETVSMTSADAVISWTTNEPARHRVMYSPVFPFLYASAQSSSGANLDNGAQVNLTSLLPATTYYYVRESIDENGNIMWTTARTFTTS